MQRVLNFLLCTSYLLLISLAFNGYFASAKILTSPFSQEQGGNSEGNAYVEIYLDNQQAYSIKAGDTLLSIALEIGVDLHEMPCLLSPDYQPDQPLIIGETLFPSLPNTTCHMTATDDSIATIVYQYNIFASELVDIGWNQAAYPSLLDTPSDSPLPAGLFLRIPPPSAEQEIVNLTEFLQRPVDGNAPVPSAVNRDQSQLEPAESKPVIAMVVGIESISEDSVNGPVLPVLPVVSVLNDDMPTLPILTMPALTQNRNIEIIGPTPDEWPYGSGDFVWPLQGWLTQNYHNSHRAVDIAAPTGTPIVATDRGTVTRAGWNNQGYGFFVIIDHNIGYVTLYAHLSEIWVNQGDVVTQGQFLGAVGSTGNSTGPHLHLELRDFGQRVDPLNFLTP